MCNANNKKYNNQKSLKKQKKEKRNDINVSIELENSEKKL